MKSTRSKILLISAVVILAIGALLGRSGSVYVCLHCGALASETEWLLPFTSVRLFHGSQQFAATPVSTTVTSLGMLDHPMAHDFVLVHTVGNKVVCALGPGGSLYLSVKSQRVGDLVRAAHETGAIGLRDELVRRTLRRDTSFLVHQLAESAPPAAFADPNAFREWRRDKTAEIERLLQRSPSNEI